ncbi:TetR family transcriptional regulator [Sulfitobacter sp. BDSS02]|nr:TetR family transcriptional regulator [Sulfitobacter sp. BDSS02]MBR9848124.1 TetR/AcrR family transcriptional regulator [Paracoccaceae bacterium]
MGSGSGCLQGGQGIKRLDTVRQQLLEEAEITNVQDKALVQSRREQICDAALELFLEKGFASTTIRDICARSGVNQASIYDYIANKNDILRRLLNQVWFRQDVKTLPEILEDTSIPLEEVFIGYFRETWSKKRNGALLAYRSVPHLLSEDRHAMRIRELALIKDIADQLRRRSGRELDDAELEVLANVLLFLSVYAPMRDWLSRDIPEETVIRTVAVGAAAMVRELIAETGPR